MIYFDIESTSLNSETGMLVTIGLILPNNETKVFFVENPDKEKEVLYQAIEFLSRYKEEPIIIWYAGFDIPFLVSRAARHGIDISEIYEFKIIDLCKLVQKNLKFENYKLDSVAKFFGIKKDLSISGKDTQTLYLNYLNGDSTARDQIIQHCREDLICLKKIFEKLEKYVEKWLRLNTSFK